MTDHIKFEAEVILASILPLLKLRSPATSRILKVADLRWYACRYCPPNTRGKTGWYGSSVNTHRSFMINSHFISSGVLTLMENNDDSKKAILEHIVPHKILVDQLYQAQPRTTAELRDFFIANLHVGFVMQDEDKRLNDAGLKSSMPEGSHTSERLARYHAAKITGIQLRDFQTGAKFPIPRELG